MHAMTGAHQGQLGARLDHNRRYLLARTVSDALTQVTTALAEATLQGDTRPEVWRLAAARTSQLLAMLDLGARSLGQPLPAESATLVEELRAWAVTMDPAQAAQGPGPDLHPPSGPGPGMPRGQAAALRGLRPEAVPGGGGATGDDGPAGPGGRPGGPPGGLARSGGPGGSAARVAGRPRPPARLTAEWRQALHKLCHAGGRLYRDAFAAGVLLDLLRADLIAPRGREQVEITNHGIRSLAAAEREPSGAASGTLSTVTR